MLRGFVEFFGALDNREREQILGSTLDKAQSDSSEIRRVFESEFQILVDGLVKRRSEYLSRAQKREGRHNVYAFPLEFAEAKDNLSRFVTRVFQPNPYQVTPIFRGFYFTSGTQEGNPLEGVINKIADKFGLSSHQSHGPSTGRGEKELFHQRCLYARYYSRSIPGISNAGIPVADQAAESGFFNRSNCIVGTVYLARFIRFYT